jgi:hypothetical protein
METSGHEVNHRIRITIEDIPIDDAVEQIGAFDNSAIAGCASAGSR